MILVLGRESSVRGTRFFNGELVTEVAVKSAGLRIDMRQERVFRNRYGTDIYEDILHFRATDEIPDEGPSLATARRIAVEVLSVSRPLTRTEERPGLDDAIACVDRVSPSPMPAPGALSHALA